MDNIHKGHRARMREKLLRVGEEAFNTYELLEMMLYYVVPYKDTNPISQRLFLKFGSLEGIFSASEAELCEVEGVGTATARYIREISEFCNGLTTETGDLSYEVFTKEKIGEYAINLVKEAKEPTVFLLLFDGKMRLLDKASVTGDLGSAAVRPSEFVKRAVLSNAVGAVTVHSHPYGPLFMSESDRTSVILIRDAFDSVGVTLLTNIIVSGDKHKAFDF